MYDCTDSELINLVRSHQQSKPLFIELSNAIDNNRNNNITLQNLQGNLFLNEEKLLKETAHISQEIINDNIALTSMLSDVTRSLIPKLSEINFDVLVEKHFPGAVIIQ
jgi:hypothetical protein